MAIYRQTKQSLMMKTACAAAFLAASCGCSRTTAEGVSSSVAAPRLNVPRVGKVAVQNTKTLVIAPAEAPTSTDRYVVRVRQGQGAWRNVGLYNFLSQHIYNWSHTAEPRIGIFECDGPVQVSVQSKVPIKSVVVRPLSRAIKTVVQGNTITFTVDNKSRQIALEVNGDPLHALLLFTNPVKNDAPQPGAADVLYFGPGYHKAGDISLEGKENQTVYLANGAVVEGTLKVHGCKNLRIAGSGVLFAPQSATQVPLKIDSCSGTMSGVTVISRAENWTFWCHANHDFTISNAKIIGEIRDGIDVINSQRITISNCYVQTQDDSICIKGLQYANTQNVEDVKVERCVINNIGGGSGLEIGHELDAPLVRNITFHDIDIIHNIQDDRPELNNPAFPTGSITIHPTIDTGGRNAQIQDILYDDIRVEDDRDPYFIDIWTNKPNSSATSSIKNITFRNVRLVAGALRPSRIQGNAQATVSNVRFEGLYNQQKLIDSAQVGLFQIGANVSDVTFGAAAKAANAK